MTLDAGVHNADILQYYFGDAASAFGQVRLYEKMRVAPQYRRSRRFLSQVGGGHARVIEPTGEDAMFGRSSSPTAPSGSGSTTTPATAGRSTTAWSSARRGSITAPGDRNGRPVRLSPRRRHEIADQRILDYAPSYRLSPVAAELFGGERIWTLQLRFPHHRPQDPGARVPRDGACVRTGTQPEVDGAGGAARHRAGVRPVRVGPGGPAR